MSLRATEWISGLPPQTRVQAAEALDLAVCYDRRVIRMECMVVALEIETELARGRSGVAFADIRDVHGVVLSPDTSKTLTSAVRSGIDNFVSLTAGSIGAVRPRPFDREAELRLQALVTDACSALREALLSGPMDSESVRARVMSAVDALWQAHAVPAMHALRAKLALDMRVLRSLAEPPKSAAHLQHAKRASWARFECDVDADELLAKIQRKLGVSLDCASWHGLQVAPAGLPLLGPASHAPLVHGEHKAHIASLDVPTEGLCMPVVQLAHVLRSLVHGGYFKGEVLSSEVVCRLLRADIQRYKVAFAGTVADIGSAGGFDPAWALSGEKHSAPTPRPPPPRKISTPPLSADLVADPLFRRIDLHARVFSASGPFDRALSGLQIVPEDLEVDYATTTTLLAAINGHHSRSTRIEIQTSDILPRVRVLLARVGREYLAASLVQKVSAMLKRLPECDFGNSVVKLLPGRVLTVDFCGVNVVHEACLALSDLLRDMEMGAVALPWPRVARFRKRDRRP